MLTDPDKQATENREPANEMNKKDPTQGVPVCLQPFTVNLEDLETHVHIPLQERSQIRKVMLQKWRHKKTEAQCSCLLPLKPKEIYSASGKVW